MGLLGDIVGIGGGILGGGAFTGLAAGLDGDFRKKLGGWLTGDNTDRNAALDPANFQMQGGDYLRNYASGQLGGVQGRQAPTAQAQQLAAASQLAGGPQNQVRGQMMNLAGQMQGVADGSQAGAGELAVRRQANQAAANQFAGMNMARGGNAPGAARNAARALGDLGTNAAGMASTSALSDQMNARGQLAGLLQGTRGQDLDFASQNAQLQQQRNLMQGQFGQQTNLANQQAALQQRGMNDQYGLGLMGQYAGVSEAELRARMARAGMYQEDKGMLPDLLQMGGTMGAAAMSDVRAKSDIRAADGEMDAALAAMQPVRYVYLDEAHGRGSRVGILAQDMAATPAGADALTVVETAEGERLALDPHKALSFALAAVARLDARVRELESLVENR